MNKQDFESKYSGLEIDEAVGKGLGLNPENSGWVKLPSTAEAPVDIDTIFNPGNYMTVYASGAIPTELVGVSPINFTITEAPYGSSTRFVQFINYADLSYYRYKGTNQLWDPNWTRALASNYIYSNDETTPPENPEGGTIWIHPATDGKTMTMKVYYSGLGWRDLRAEGLMVSSVYDPTNQKTDLFALIDQKFVALKIDADAMKAHMADKVIHITAAERTAWNAKVTNEAFNTAKETLKTEITTQITTQTGGYEVRLNEFNTRVTGLQNTLNAHAANAIIHVNQTDIDTWSGKADANHTHFNDNRVTIDAKDVTSGIFDLARIPKEAFSEVEEVATVADMYKLTKAQVQNGDTVHVLTPSSFYFVVDDTKLNVAAGYTIYSVGVLDEILWANIRNKPTTIGGFGITDAYTKKEVDEKVKASIDIVSGELNKHAAMINYAVTNDILQDVQDVFYPQENLNILQGGRRDNQLYPYAESEIWTTDGRKLGIGFNEWSVLPKYGTDDFMYGGPYSNQPYRIPKTPSDYNPSSFKTKFPEEFIDETTVAVKYYHMDTLGKVQAGAPPQVPNPGGGTDNTVIRWLTDWQQLYCGTDPSAPIAVKKIKSYQILRPTAPYSYSSHICIIRRQNDHYSSNCGHLAIAYENASRDTIEILENPFLSYSSSSTTEKNLLLKRRNWQGFMVNPNAPNITLGGVTSAINDTTLNFAATSTNPTTSIDLLLNSVGGFLVYDFDFDANSKTLVIFGSVRISMNNGAAPNAPRLTCGTMQGSTAVPARSVPAILTCDIIYSANHPGAATVNQELPQPDQPYWLANYIVGFLPVSLQVCPPSGNSTGVYANRFGLNFFDTDAAMTGIFQSPEKQMCVKCIMPSTYASPPMVTNDRRSAFMLYADHHYTATVPDSTPYPISFIFSSWNPSAHDNAATSFTLRRSAYATAMIPEHWVSSAKAPIDSNRLLPNLQIIEYETIMKSGSRYKSSMLVGSMASAKDSFDGTLCPWYMIDPYTYYQPQNTTEENSRLPNIKYRRTKQFWFGTHGQYQKRAYRITDPNHALTANGADLQNARDSYYFFRTPDVIDSNNKYPVYLLVNGTMNRWAAIRIAWDNSDYQTADTAIYQETLDPLPADTLIASMYPRQMQLVNKSTEPPAPWNHFYHLPISDIGIIPYTIRPYDALLRDDYGTKLREMTEAIDRQRIRTGTIWAKRGNLVEMTGMTTILSWMPMGTPYTDTAFLGTVNSEYYIGYITEYGEVHKRKLIAGGSKADLTNFHPRAIFSAAIWYDSYDYGSTVHNSPVPEQVGLLGYNDKATTKCLERVNIPNFYSFVASMNESLGLASASGNIFIDSNVTIPDTFCNNKESFIKVIGGGLEVADGASGDFLNKLPDSHSGAWQAGCQMALLYNKSVNFDYGPSGANNDQLIIAGASASVNRYIKVIDASVYNPTNISGKGPLYRDLIHSSDGVPIYFAICGKSGDASSYEAVMIIPKRNASVPEIIRVPWPTMLTPWHTGYYRTSHQWMYLKGKACRCEGHPAFVTSTKIIVVQILARIPKDATVPRIQIIEQFPVNLKNIANLVSFGTIGQGTPGTQKNPTTDMDIAPIIMVASPLNEIPDSVYVYKPPVDETDLSDATNLASLDKNYFPVYATDGIYSSTPGNALVINPPGQGVKPYAYPGFKLAKPRDLGIVGADGSWYVTMTASRALSEQINFGRMVQDAYTWKNQAQFQNTQIQSMWKTIHDAQPMLQSILNLV